MTAGIGWNRGRVNLEDLIADNRTSLDDAIRQHIEAVDFTRDQQQHSRFEFWNGAVDQPHPWEHQKVAIATVTAYLNGEKSIPERPDHTEAALLKLPTGTGKSGVIAVIARCLPAIQKVSILTPRTSLTELHLRDIKSRFWGHLGYEIQNGELFTAEAAAFGAALETVYTETFLPSRRRSMSLHLDDVERAILVGTRYIASSVVWATVVPLIAWVHHNWGFDVLFHIFTASAFAIVLAVLLLPNRLPEPQLASGSP